MLDQLTPRIPSEPLREPFEDAYEVIELLICEALNSYKIIYSGFCGSLVTGRKLLKKMVGAEGFEPPASCSQSRFHCRPRILCFQLLYVSMIYGRRVETC